MPRDGAGPEHADGVDGGGANTRSAVGAARGDRGVNELALFGGRVRIALKASFRVSGPASLRVVFRTLTVTVFGVSLPDIVFPSGTERTWLLTYTDEDFRIVRAGVDGATNFRKTQANSRLVQGADAE